MHSHRQCRTAPFRSVADAPRRAQAGPACPTTTYGHRARESWRPRVKFGLAATASASPRCPKRGPVSRRFWRPRRHAGGAVILAPCAFRGASRLLSPRPTYRSADRCDQNVLFCPRCREFPHPQGPAPSEWAAKHVVETPSWRPPRVRPHGSRQSKAHGSRGFPIRMVVGHGGVRHHSGARGLATQPRRAALPTPPWA